MFHIRFANISDSKDIFNWRNDPVSRQMSHSKHNIDWKEHSQWFAASLENQNKCILMCEKKRTFEKVAVVHFDIEYPRALISINISPLMRGKGNAKCCLINTICFFSEFYPDVIYLNAEIKLLNIASKRSFESVGFSCIKKKIDVLFYEYKIKSEK